MNKPKLVVFASGTREGGGSGFEHLIQATQTAPFPVLDAEIVAVVSNHENGGVRQKADRYGIRFVHFPRQFEACYYKHIVREWKADFVALSGWIKLVRGLDPKTTFNIHPGPLPVFGGKGLYGLKVHEQVLAAFKRGEINCTEMSMHFVSAEYDEGPVFFRYRVPIEETDSAEDIQARVGMFEHTHQARITNMVVQGQISWDGVNDWSLKLPPGYFHHLRQWQLFTKQPA